MERDWDITATVFGAPQAYIETLEELVTDLVCDWCEERGLDWMTSRGPARDSDGLLR